MTSHTFNLHHKLHYSVQYLATGNGSLKDRLSEVFVSYLLSLKCDSNNSEVEKLIQEAQDLATSIKDPHEKFGHLYYTMMMSHWTLKRKIADTIFRAYELTVEELRDSAR